MKTRTLLLIAALSVGGCCVCGTGVLVLGGLVADDSPSGASPSASPHVASNGGDPKLGGYIIFGTSTPVADGFGESLEGNWMLMDGASVESIESIHSDHVVVKSKRTGELWHFTFEGDGSYVFRYLITSRYGAVIWVEKGEWTADGTQLTLTPQACTSKAPSETTDCFEPGARTYALTTVQMEEFMPGDQKGATWKGVRFTGPFPAFSQTTNPYAYRELQRVQ